MTNDPPDRFSASPDPAIRGGTLDITYTDDTLKQGDTVHIEISDGVTTETVQVTIGENGSGSTSWDVPASWGAVAVLSSSDSADHTVAVQ